ncbi:MAG: guanylate kinase [Synergistaceae bacterium]|nr:guanylate kinase [Synergistaceae bacterium]
MDAPLDAPSGQTRKGRLFVLGGPSGVGKGTLRAQALADIDNLSYSISCTTRKPRVGERDGVDYHFITREDFEDKAAQGLFLEHATVHEDRYGTLREDVTRELDAGHDVLLEIDVQGAQQIQRLLPESVLIFIAPPSLEALEERLRLRRTESEDKIKLRLENAKKEMERSSDYDHIILNDVLDHASKELRDLITRGGEAPREE